MKAPPLDCLNDGFFARVSLACRKFFDCLDCPAFIRNFVFLTPGREDRQQAAIHMRRRSAGVPAHNLVSDLVDVGEIAQFAPKFEKAHTATRMLAGAQIERTEVIVGPNGIVQRPAAGCTEIEGEDSGQVS